MICFCLNKPLVKNLYSTLSFYLLLFWILIMTLNYYSEFDILIKTQNFRNFRISNEPYTFCKVLLNNLVKLYFSKKSDFISYWYHWIKMIWENVSCNKSCTQGLCVIPLRKNPDSNGWVHSRIVRRKLCISTCI